jgi:hypothetical protein
MDVYRNLFSIHVKQAILYAFVRDKAFNLLLKISQLIALLNMHECS